jgi:hypothetical protein
MRLSTGTGGWALWRMCPPFATSRGIRGREAPRDSDGHRGNWLVSAGGVAPPPGEPSIGEMPPVQPLV